MSDNRAQLILIALKNNAADWMFEPDHDVTSADVIEAHLKHLDDELAAVKAQRDALLEEVGQERNRKEGQSWAQQIAKSALAEIATTKGTNE